MECSKKFDYNCIWHRGKNLMIVMHGTALGIRLKLHLGVKRLKDKNFLFYKIFSNNLVNKFNNIN